MYPIRSFFLALSVILLLTANSAGQGLTHKELDARIEKQLYDVLSLGTDVFNRGGQDACFRLYQGSLMTIMGFLEHRPDQIARIKKALRSTDDLLTPGERAFALRTAMDDLREAIKTTHTTQNAATPPTAPVPTRPALWNRLGGELTVTLVIEELVNRILKNPRINFTRLGTGSQWDANPENVNRLKKQFIAWFSSVTGGPLKYEGKDMKSAHTRMRIADPEFDIFLQELRASLEKYFVSPDEIKEILRLFDAQRKDIVDSTIVTKPLWDRLGSETTVTLIVNDFVTRTAKNPAVNFTRQGLEKEWKGTPEQVSLLKKRLVQWISSMSGGPLKYDGKPMKDAHTGMKISEAEFNAFVLDLKKSLEQYKVPLADQDELLNAISAQRKDFVEKK